MKMKKAVAKTAKPERRIPRTLSRRTLLKGALGAAVALPWLELMRPRGLRGPATAREGAWQAATVEKPTDFGPIVQVVDDRLGTARPSLGFALLRWLGTRVGRVHR